MKRRTVLTFLATVPLLARASSASSLLVRMGYFDNYWPFSRRMEDGVMQGALVDAVNRVAQHAGIGVEHAGFPWARAQKMVERGELDGFCTVRTQLRLVYAEFCETPLVSVPYGIYHRRDDKRTADLQSIGDLRRFRQGSYYGSGYSKEHLDQEGLFLDDSAESVLRRIAKGDLDTMVESESTGSAKVRALGLQESLTFTPLAFLPRAEYRFGLRRQFPDGASVLARMESAAQALHKSGVLASTLARYRNKAD